MDRGGSDRKGEVVTRIRAAVVELMETCDLDKISVVDVVGRAGIARSSFYRYYESVEDVVQEMEDEFLDACRSALRRFVASGFTENGLERGDDSIVRIFEVIRARADFYRVAMGPHGDPSFERRQESLTREFYGSKLFFEGIVPHDADLRLSFIAAGQTRLISEWLSKYPEMSAREVAEAVQRISFAIMHA